MSPEKKVSVVAPSSNEPELLLQRPPMLIIIIVYKLVKWILFLSLAVVLYCKSDNDLPVEFQNLMATLRIHPGNKFFTHLAEQVGQLTESNVLWAAAGTLIYSTFSLVEGIGMIFRAGWAGWLAIGESAFFIPIEFYDVSSMKRFSWWVFIVLIMNMVFVWYLFQNRERLFHHHHHPTQPTPVP